MTKRSKYISFDRAIKQTAKVKGVTEKEAEAMLMEALRRGELTGYAIIHKPPETKQ